MNARIKKNLTLLLCIAVCGCVSTAPKKNTTSKNATTIVTDETFGRYQENIEPGLILITITPEEHARLTQLKPVPMNGSLPPQYANFLNDLKGKYGLTRVANWPLPAIDIFCVVFQLQDTSKKSAVIAALAVEPGIETAQAVQTFDTQTQQYNDPYLGLQHAVHSMQAIRSHEWSRGKGVRVAVVDTGTDNTHSELVSSTETTRNFVDKDAIQFRTDSHGTAVSGVIAANANNLKGMVGIAPDASLLAIKACWQSKQTERKAVCNSLTLAKALNYSIQENVDIINLSLTGPPDPVLERLVLKAIDNNIVVVGAKPPHDRKAFPVSIPGAIAVSMPDKNARTISAPGKRVLSLEPNENYDFFDGSSFSTAHITGLAALLRSLAPKLTPADILALLEQSTDPTSGMVNACRAVEAVRQNKDEQANLDLCG